MSNIVTGIDVGTYHVKVVIAQLTDDPRQPPRILGSGYAESRGVTQGYITSVEDASRSIAAAVLQASRAAKVPVKRAYVAIGGVGLDEAFARGETVVERGDSEITERDIPRAIAASEKALPPAATLNRKMIHTIPLRFLVDGVPVMGGNAVGMKGMRVSVETLCITCIERHVRDLVEAVEGAGVEVEDVVAAPIAASFVALSKMQKRVGCVLTNTGSETHSIVVCEDSKPISLKVFPIGGANITNDLALALKISPEDAESLKQGAIFDAGAPKKKIDDVINRRLSEMFKLVEAHLKRIGKNELLPGGVVLTGGGSLITSAPEVAKHVLKLPAKMALLSEGMASKQLGDGIWAVAYGLTVWGFTSGEGIEHSEVGSFDNIKGSMKGFFTYLKKFLP